MQTKNKKKEVKYLILKRKKKPADIDKKKKSKIIELYTKQTSMIEIRRQTGIDKDSIKEIIEQYLEDEAELNAIDSQMKEKFSKKKVVAEPPYMVMKIVKERDKKGKVQRKKVYSQQMLDEPYSEADFMNFVEMYGDGSYSVLDKSKRLIKHIDVENVAGFDDPLENEEEEEGEEEEEQYSQSYPTQTFTLPKGKGKGKGKTDPLTQQAMQSLEAQNYKIAVKRRMGEICLAQGKPELAERYFDEAEKLEREEMMNPKDRKVYEAIEKENSTINFKTRMAEILMEQGQLERANTIINEVTKLEELKTMSLEDKEHQKGLSLISRKEEITLRMASTLINQGNTQQANKLLTSLGMMQDKGELSEKGKNKFTELADTMDELKRINTSLGITTGKEAEKSKGLEIAEIADKLLDSGKRNIIEPIKGYLTGEQEAEDDIFEELYQEDVPQQQQQQSQRQYQPQPQSQQEIIQKRIIPTAPQQQQQQQPPRSDEDILISGEEEEELKIAKDSDEPISPLELDAKAKGFEPPDKITKITFEHKYIINKVFPIWTVCISNDVDPVTIARNHFDTITTFPNVAFIGKRRLLKMYRASKNGLEFFTQQWQPFIDKMDGKYSNVASLFIKDGEQVFRNNFQPPQGMSLNKAVKIIKHYIKFRGYWNVFTSDKGKIWIEIYQKTMFDFLDEYLRKVYQKKKREIKEIQTTVNKADLDIETIEVTKEEPTKIIKEGQGIIEQKQEIIEQDSETIEVRKEPPKIIDVEIEKSHETIEEEQKVIPLPPIEEIEEKIIPPIRPLGDEQKIIDSRTGDIGEVALNSIEEQRKIEIEKQKFLEEQERIEMEREQQIINEEKKTKKKTKIKDKKTKKKIKIKDKGGIE